jgi:hypothetical protein
MKRNLLLLFALIMIGFSSNAQVSLIGVGATGDWGVDADMVDQGGGLWALNGHTMPGGEFKFRLDHAWTTAWGNGLGGATFPDGTADTTPGENNNIVAIAGTYDITFDQNTGVFSFSGGAPVSVVKIIGTATAAPVNMTTLDAENYTATNVTLTDGNAQFEIDGLAFGGTAFPIGVATSTTDLIPVPAGTYSSITYNIALGDYVFTAAPVFPSIALVGSGTLQGWPSDPQVDANVLTTTDGETYKGSFSLIVGEVKFRSNNNWSDPNWGGVTFPSGPDAGNPGGNIAVPAAGYYDVVFTRSTGAYTFSFPTIAIVGSGTPQGWPSDPQVDAAVLATTDGAVYLASSVTLLDGEIKLRANNNWDVNWGAAAWPSGTGTQGGANIPSVAGTYDVAFERATGNYTFTALGTKSFANSNFKVYPNPTANNWNFAAVKGSIQTVQIVDMLGKTIMSVSPTAANVTVDASALNAGVYFARITTATATETVKVVRN